MTLLVAAVAVVACTGLVVMKWRSGRRREPSVRVQIRDVRAPTGAETEADTAEGYAPGWGGLQLPNAIYDSKSTYSGQIITWLLKYLATTLSWCMQGRQAQQGSIIML